MINKELDYEKFKDANSKEVKTSRKVAKKTSRRRSFNFVKVQFFQDLINDASLRNKIFFTLFIVAVYRFLASIPLPGVDMGVFDKFFNQSSTASEANYFFTIFTGGFLETPSIVGLGIAAYINASIIMQLLTPVIPKLSELSKEGARGQQLVNQYTRYLTLPLSLMYSTIYLLFLSQRNLNDPNNLGTTGEADYLIPRAAGSEWPSISKIIFMALILTAGSMFLMWLAEAITENGLGNGSSIIISIGIVSSIPTLISQDFAGINLVDSLERILAGSLNALTDQNILIVLGLILGLVLVMGMIVFANESVRNIKINYARRASSASPAQDSKLPIKLTLTGVLPIIFASALLSAPQIVVSLLSEVVDETNVGVNEFINSIQNGFLLASSDNVVNSNDILYAVVYFVLIVLFGMFYAFIALKPSDTAENLQKNSAYIPGIRPGKSTEEYISRVLLRVGFAGSVFLAFIALVPLVARNLVVEFTGINLFILSGIGGSSILIVVSVFLDTMRQYSSLRATKSYEKYI